MALSEGRVGPVGKVSDGTTREFRFDSELGQVTQDAHGRYTELSRRGYGFIAHNVAAQAISVALATTYTGLCISNPLGNTKNLVILGAGLALSVAPAAIASIHIIG